MTEEKNNYLKGIGGWLCFFAFCLCVGLILKAIIFILSLRFFSLYPLSFEIISEPYGESINLGLIVLIALNFFHETKVARPLLYCFYAFIVLLLGLMAWFDKLEFLILLVPPVTWMLYFWRSKRVKNTFVKKVGKKKQGLFIGISLIPLLVTISFHIFSASQNKNKIDLGNLSSGDMFIYRIEPKNGKDCYGVMQIDQAVRDDYLAGHKEVCSNDLDIVKHLMEDVSRFAIEPEIFEKATVKSLEDYLVVIKPLTYPQAVNLTSLAIKLEKSKDEQSRDRALRLFEMAALKGVKSAKLQLALRLLEDEEEGDFSLALELLEDGALGGDPYAQLRLGSSLLDKDKKEFNPEEAIKWLKKAADNREKYAYLELGDVYLNGDIVQKDEKEAARYFRLYANMDYTKKDAMFADLYFYGIGVDSDLERANEYWKVAYKAGHKQAKYDIDSYEYFKNLTLEDKGALEKKLKRQVESGETHAHLELGKLYLYGRNDKEKWTKAIPLIKNAAGNGNAEAQYILAGLYAYGRGVEKNDKEALNYLKKSAQKGFFPAKFLLK